MTAQIHDSVVWRNQEHSLVGVEGAGLFDPAEHDLDVHPTTTANWRGWVARYVIQDDRLRLADLHDVGLALLGDEKLPKVNGVAPVREGRGPWSYPALNLPVPFSGRLLIARGFIQSLYRHMGFHPAWKYEESWELELDDGRLTEARDVSSSMEQLRSKIEADPMLDPDSEARPGWIERTFTLAFRRSKGR